MAQVLELVKVENLKRQLCMFTAQGEMLREQSRVLNLIEIMASSSIPREKLLELEEREEESLEYDKNRVIGKLTCKLIQAVNLPKMDMFRDCDPYVVTYLDSSAKDQIKRTEPQRKQRNPKFDQEYTWDIERVTRWLTITVMDKDQLTKDDIVGCLNIDVSALTPGETVQKFYNLENPNLTKKLRGSQIEILLHRSAEQRDDDHGLHTRAPPKLQTDHNDGNQPASPKVAAVVHAPLHRLLAWGLMRCLGRGQRRELKVHW